jgi:hypothetical protein
MTDLTSSLSCFSPISLEEMDHVQLLDRIDTKFVIREDQLLDVLEAIKEKYNILVINGVSLHPYETLYFDTPGLHLYRMHHNGIRNRYKLRCRKYVNSGISFFEIKSKTNTSRTVKDRMKLECFVETLDESLNQYIKEHTPGKYQDYIPVLKVYFDRLTLVNKKANERLTFDINLSYKNNGTEAKIPGIVIVEIKQEKCSASPFQELMKQNRQPKNYLSKYCLGLTCLDNGLKKNLFKQKINDLNKLGYEVH